MIPVSDEVRKHAGVAAGDEVEVNIELDTEARDVTVPPDFAEALDRNARSKAGFDTLSYSNKSRFVLSIEQAKTAETRKRRIEKAVSELHEETAKSEPIGDREARQEYEQFLRGAAIGSHHLYNSFAQVEQKCYIGMVSFELCGA